VNAFVIATKYLIIIYVRHRASRAIWALDPSWTVCPVVPDAYVRETEFKAHEGHGSKSRSIMSGPKPVGLVIEICTCQFVVGKLPSTSHLLCAWVLKKALLWMLGDSLANSAAEHHPFLEVGTSSNATHTILPTKHPFSENNIGPPFPLTLRVIMIFPLILNYKYMRLRKEKGVVEGLKGESRI